MTETNETAGPSLVVQENIASLIERERAGRIEHGGDLDRQDLPVMRWLEELRCESLDSANYATKLMHLLPKLLAAVAVLERTGFTWAGDEWKSGAAQEAVAWQVGDDFYTSESLAIEGIQQWGPSGSIAIPLYAAPVAAPPSAPVGVEGMRIVFERRATEVASRDLATRNGRHLNAQGHQQAINAIDFCLQSLAQQPAAPDDLHAHLLHMLGAKDHEDAGRIIGELHAARMPTPAAPGIDVDALAQEIRRVDGTHSVGAGALAEALVEWLSRHVIDASPKGSDLEFCAWDRDECTVTLAFDTELQVEDFIGTHAARNRVRVVDDSPKGGSDAPDMFWNDADPERAFDSIIELVSQEWSNGSVVEGDVMEIQQAIRLPNIKVRVVESEYDGVDYERIAAAQAKRERKAAKRAKAVRHD